ncbi:MAG: hypothetical protein RMJ19_01815 [Gemmatales bacterium]|nr:hypothetical protein [Gemmatales bacterium]MDW8174382.1 hypothetical protein [Gemmatales bacterium]
MNNKPKFIPMRSLRRLIGRGKLTGEKALKLRECLGSITLLTRNHSSAYIGVAQWPKGSGSPPVLKADFQPADNLKTLYKQITGQNIKRFGAAQQQAIRNHYHKQGLEIVFLTQNGGTSIAGGMIY